MTTIKRVIRDTVEYNEFVRGEDTNYYLDEFDVPNYDEFMDIPLDDLGMEF